MEILVCVKRVPMVGGKIVVTPDGQDVDTRMSGFTVSPHEECAVEEAVRIVERLGGSVTVLTLGPAEAADQLRDMLALGAVKACCWKPTAASGGRSPRRRRSPMRSAPAGPAGYDLLLFGNEAADTGDYQVPVRVAHALGLPCVTGIKDSRYRGGDGAARARREYRGTQETFDLPLPAVVSVKEGINLPRYPSLPGPAAGEAGGDRALRAALAGRGPAQQRLRVPARASADGPRSSARHRCRAGPGALLDELGVLP